MTRIRVALATAALAVLALAAAGDGGGRSADFVSCSTTTIALDRTQKVVDLSGEWRGADGLYQLRQAGTCLWWASLGQDGRPASAFFGQVIPQFSQVRGLWAELGTGRTARGSVVLLYKSPLTKISVQPAPGVKVPTTSLLRTR